MVLGAKPTSEALRKTYDVVKGIHPEVPKEGNTPSQQIHFVFRRQQVVNRMATTGPDYSVLSTPNQELDL